MRFSAFVLAVAFARTLLAQNADVPRLRLGELIAEGLNRNPEVLAAQKRYEAARQRPAQERSLPDPMVSFGWNASGRPWPGAGLGTEPTANIGVMASQELPYPGKLRLKGVVASKEADAEGQQFRTVQLNLISRLKQAFYRLQHAYAMLDVLARNRSALESLLRVTESRYSVGKAAQADVFRAQTQITMLEARIVQIERERRSREAELTSLLSRPQNVALGRPEEPHMQPLAFTESDLLAKTSGMAPMLARDQKMIERARSALSLARKDFYPDFTVNGGYYNMGSMPSMYMFRADVKVPLRLGRTRAEVAERNQELAGARYAYESDARSLEYRIRDEYNAAETAQKLLELYLKTALPQARLAVESALASYQTGTLDFTAVLANEVAAFEYEMNYHEQMQEFHLALARLEEMTGVELAQ
jgi:cobalt-zinc-cadmium efflux system outer membrane protein